MYHRTPTHPSRTLHQSYGHLHQHPRHYLTLPLNQLHKIMILVMMTHQRHRHLPSAHWNFMPWLLHRNLRNLPTLMHPRWIITISRAATLHRFIAHHTTMGIHLRTYLTTWARPPLSIQQQASYWKRLTAEFSYVTYLPEHHARKYPDGRLAFATPT